MSQLCLVGPTGEAGLMGRTKLPSKEPQTQGPSCPCTPSLRPQAWGSPKDLRGKGKEAALSTHWPYLCERTAPAPLPSAHPACRLPDYLSRNFYCSPQRHCSLAGMWKILGVWQASDPWVLAPGWECRLSGPWPAHR